MKKFSFLIFFKRSVLKQGAFLLVVIGFIGTMGGCSGKPTLPRHTVWFSFEATPLLPPALVKNVVLPYSEVAITISSKPAFPPEEIIDVELVQVELGYCLAFQVGPQVSIPLYQTSMLNLGKKIVLMNGSQALGFRLLDVPIMDGQIYIFVEMSESEMRAFVQNLKCELRKTPALSLGKERTLR